MVVDPAAVADARILVVDDVLANRLVAEAALRAGGFSRIVLACDGFEALEAVERDPPDCILLDILMPGIDGYEVCRRLRADRRHGRLPIIVLTALSDADARTRAFEAGASDVVAKPFHAKELIARVRVHVNNHLMALALRAYHERMEAELADARILAEAILPQPELLAELTASGVSFDHRYHPHLAIGGDFWAAWPLSPDTLALFVGDVSGHGVPAALRAFALRALVSPPPPFGNDPVRVAGHLDRRLHDSGHRHGHFVAGMYGILDLNSLTMSYVGAGLRNGFVLRGNRALDPVRLSGLPFGLAAAVPRTLRSVGFSPGDVLILYSDALVECQGNADAPKNEAELLAWLEGALARRGAVPDRLANALADMFLAEFGDAVTDDLLIVTARIGRSRSERYQAASGFKP